LVFALAPEACIKPIPSSVVWYLPSANFPRLSANFNYYVYVILRTHTEYSIVPVLFAQDAALLDARRYFVGAGDDVFKKHSFLETTIGDATLVEIRSDPDRGIHVYSYYGYYFVRTLRNLTDEHAHGYRH
jgi:hypothetical protein